MKGHQLSRRMFVSGVATAAIGSAFGLPAAAAPLEKAEWLAYTTRYVTNAGRVVDTSNNAISHSEGQGYAMLLAVAFDDRETFDRLWMWTRRNLQVREDRLFAWKWDPQHKGGQVSDQNNASDGDILIAWALYRAAHHWNERAFALAGELIAADVIKNLVVPSEYGPLLLPAMEGFVDDERTVVNPSYWVFPALDELAVKTGITAWRDVIMTGLSLLAQAKFGEHELPPDWLDLAGELRPAPGFDPVYGFNAVRMPLYLAWSGEQDALALLGPYVALPDAFGGLNKVPATINLDTGETAEFPLSTGAQAGLMLAQAQATDTITQLPRLRPSEDYYSSTLLLISKLAVKEISQ